MTPQRSSELQIPHTTKGKKTPSVSEIQQLSRTIKTIEKKNQQELSGIRDQLGAIHRDIQRLLSLRHKEIAPMLESFLTEGQERGFTTEQWCWIHDMLTLILDEQSATFGEDRKEALSEIQSKNEKGISVLHIHSNLDISSWDTLKKLPSPLIVHGFLDISFCIRMERLGNIIVEGDLIVEGCPDHIIDEAHHLKEAGKITGGIILQKPE